MQPQEKMKQKDNYKKKLSLKEKASLTKDFLYNTWLSDGQAKQLLDLVVWVGIRVVLASFLMYGIYQSFIFGKQEFVFFVKDIATKVIEENGYQKAVQ